MTRVTMSEPLFSKVPSELDFPKEEREILALWRDIRVFEKSLEQTSEGKPWVFYEGPPTANGLPHNGHVLTRVVKDPPVITQFNAVPGTGKNKSSTSNITPLAHTSPRP